NRRKLGRVIVQVGRARGRQHVAYRNRVRQTIERNHVAETALRGLGSRAGIAIAAGRAVQVVGGIFQERSQVDHAFAKARAVRSGDVEIEPRVGSRKPGKGQRRILLIQSSFENGEVENGIRTWIPI